MAHVKTTQTIWSEIQNNIERMYADRIRNAEDWYRYGLSKDEFDKIVMDSLLSPEQEAAMALLGPKFFTQNNRVSVRVATPGGREGTYQLDFPKPRSIPYGWDSYYGDNRATCTDARISAVVEKRMVAVQAVKSEKDSFLAKMKKLYDSVASVNAMVKMFPAAHDLLSPDVKQRLTQKNERADKPNKEESAEAAAQLAQLKVSMLMARVAA